MGALEPLRIGEPDPLGWGMRIASLQQLLAHLDQAANGSRRPAIVATDADGTLWSGDVGVDAFEEMVAGGLVRAQAGQALRAAARAAGLESGPEPGAIAAALNALCERGGYPEDKTYEMMAWVYAGWHSAEVRSFTRRALAARRLASRIHPEVRELLLHARSLGLDIFVVSASPHLVVEEAVAMAELPVRAIIAAEPAMEDDVIQPRMAQPIPFGAGKAEALERRAGGLPVLAALGDNSFDIEMLRLAMVPVAVHPKDKLRERASEVPELIELVAG